MKRWTVRQVLTLLLSAFVALGMSLSAVQASDMATKMTMASDMASSGHGDCQGCGGKTNEGAKLMACASPCVAPMLAVLPQSLPLTVKTVSIFFPARSPLLRGRVASPDPSPPKPSDLA